MPFSLSIALLSARLLLQNVLESECFPLNKDCLLLCIAWERLVDEGEGFSGAEHGNEEGENST